MYKSPLQGSLSLHLLSTTTNVVGGFIFFHLISVISSTA
nr:MAG TPA: hypothetical protein [Caudoviricetes sp.]